MKTYNKKRVILNLGDKYFYNSDTVLSRQACQDQDIPPYSLRMMWKTRSGKPNNEPTRSVHGAWNANYTGKVILYRPTGTEKFQPSITYTNDKPKDFHSTVVRFSLDGMQKFKLYLIVCLCCHLLELQSYTFRLLQQ